MTAAVLFDFYGTLARAVSWGTPPEEVMARFGLSIDPDARAEWAAQSGDGVEHLEHSVDRERYVAWELGRLCRLIERCGAAPADVEEVAGQVYAALKTFTLAAYDEVHDVLRQLRDRGVTVAVCSNWDWDLDHAMAQAGLDAAVDVVVTSAQAGARKPHPRIFRHTLERCRVDADDAVFVGDSWHPDVVGPLAAGLRPVHVWRPEERDGEDPPPLVDGVHRVPDLRGVLDLV